MHGIVSPSVLLENSHTENINSLVYTKLCHMLQTKANLHTNKIYMCFLSLEKEINLKTKEMAQATKCFLCKHESMHSIFNPHMKRLIMEAYACNSSAGETERGGFLRLARQATQPHFQAP